MRRIVKAAFFLGFGVAGTAAWSQPPSSKALVDAVIACRAERDDQVRLRCLDGAVDALGRAAAAGSIVMVDKADVRRTRRSLFGFSLPKLPFFTGDDTADEAPDEVQARIASGRSLGNNKWEFVLDSGAVWQTSESSPYFKAPRTGATVTLRRGTLGGYFASIGNGRAVRAIRKR